MHTRQPDETDDHADVDRVVEAILETMQTTVRFVMGRRTLKTAEAVSLSVGQVLAFPDRVDAPVDIVVDDVLIGQGELVDIEGRRGIHILTMVDSEQ